MKTFVLFQCNQIQQIVSLGEFNFHYKFLLTVDRSFIMRLQPWLKFLPICPGSRGCRGRTECRDFLVSLSTKSHAFVVMRGRSPELPTERTISCRTLCCAH